MAYIEDTGIHLKCILSEPLSSVLVSHWNGVNIGDRNVSFLFPFLPCWQESPHLNPATLVAFKQPESGIHMSTYYQAYFLM